MERRPQKKAPPGRAGIQSVEVAARILDTMAAATGPLNLKQLAQMAGMPASKAHRYLVSLCRTGMVQQDDVTGRYDLGRRALAVGLAALGRIDAVTAASQALRGLSDCAGATAVLAVWGEHGPTVVRFEETAHPVRMNVRVGSTLPVTVSAIGQVFAAFLPPAVVEPFLAAERARFGDAVGRDMLSRLIEEVRTRRIGRSVGTYVAGVTALAAPVFDAQGRIVAVIGLLGHEPLLNADWSGIEVRALGRVAGEVSERLGYAGPTVPAAV